MNFTPLLNQTQENVCRVVSLFVVRRVGDENVGWNEGVGGTAYNHSRTASNVGVLFTCLLGTIVWRSKGMD